MPTVETMSKYRLLKIGAHTAQTAGDICKAERGHGFHLYVFYVFMCASAKSVHVWECLLHPLETMNGICSFFSVSTM